MTAPRLEAVPRPAPSPTVTVVVTRDMARLLARLQQLSGQQAQVLVDLQTLTLMVCGKRERFGRLPET